MIAALPAADKNAFLRVPQFESGGIVDRKVDDRTHRSLKMKAPKL
jgi:hypothetical protein